MLNLSKKPALRRLERIQEIKMIDYSPFWKTLEQSEENWYTLTKEAPRVGQYPSQAETQHGHIHEDCERPLQDTGLRY